jgi:hypothetical protein
MLPIIDDLAELFGDVIRVAPRLQIDGKGKAVYGSDVARACHLTKGQVIEFRGADGVYHRVSMMATFAGVFGTKVTDRFTLPSGFSPQVVPAVHVMICSDENGPHHEVVYF